MQLFFLKIRGVLFVQDNNPRGWILLYVSADTKGIMVSRISITRENLHDATQFGKLITG
jgi:hypothetical protein